MISAEMLRFLRGRGRPIVAQVDWSQGDELWWATELRRTLTPAEANAVLELVWLRERAALKFERAAEMYFTREALEQSSSAEIAAYRAGRIRIANVERVADLGCGIGGDALALAAGGPVIGVDREFVRLQMAQANAAVYGVEDRFWPLQADLLNLPPFPVDALFFDPARRDESGRRFFSLADYRPPLSLLDRWRSVTPNQAIKISPGVDYAELPPAAEAEAEFISVGGALKECVLWKGGLHSGAARRATLLPNGATLMEGVGEKPVELPVGEPGAFLLEPDPAVIRAHLVGLLGARLGGRLLSSDIAYLTFDQRPAENQWGSLFAIEAWFPFQLKRLKRYVREHHIGRVEVKKRGSPLDTNQLEKSLRGRGERLVTIFLTQLRGEPIVIIGERQP